MNENNNVTRLGTMSVLSVFLVSMGVAVITPAMAVLAQHFEGHDVSWISTIPTLFVVLGSLVSGKVVGKQVKYRTMTIWGCALFVIGGCAPALFDDFTLTLVCRGIFGLGLGFLFPLGNALVIGLYSGQKQASMLGYGTLFMNTGGIIMQLLGGYLADLGWNIMFWGHAFGLIGLVMAFFLPEPEKAADSNEAGQPKEKMSKVIWVLAALFALFNMIQYPLLMYTSVLFDVRNAGDATVSALALSFNTIAGCLAGLVFGRLFKIASRWCLPLGYGIAAIGALCVYTGNTAFLMTLGLICIGFGWNLIIPSVMAWAGSVTPASTVPSATALMMGLFNLGVFISSFWMQLLTTLFGENMYSAIIAEISVFAALTVVFLFFNPYKKK